jgi:diguanylate cyclase (GGDEF)-like protein
VGIFAWHFSIRGVGADESIGTQAVPIIIPVVIGLVGATTFIKVALDGLGGLDPATVRLLAWAAVCGAAGGGLFPVLVPVPDGASGSQITIPATMVWVAFAADRQRRVGARPSRAARPRPYSLAPYVAVAATDVLLVTTAGQAGHGLMAIALAAVGLTALVAIRQVHALRQNARLLDRVDASLAEQRSYQAQLTHLAHHDGLTRLANRVLFEQSTREALAGAGHGATFSLVLIDLDDFKAINDRLGHTVGDALLVGVAERLRTVVPDTDVVARLGGDEFGLLLHGLTSEQATAVLARVTDALSRPVPALEFELLVRASTGLAEAYPDASPQELLRRADLAMYAAKESGKGRLAVYDAELEQNQAADAQLGAELRQALDRGEFSLVYQPVVSLPDGAWVGLETLVRWRHPNRGFIRPDVFIPIAERTGLIVPLGNWILRTALRQAAAWTAEYGAIAHHRIGINVSARQLVEPGFADDVATALDEGGYDPGLLVIEVTETAVFESGVACDTVGALKKLGCRIALDDFGTGHSSLGLLRTCPVDALKVDKSFVAGIGTASEEAVIVTALIAITDGLHLQAVAEGVETAEQAATLHRLGYRYAQGYHFSPPLAAEQIVHHLAARHSLAASAQ